MWAVSTIPWVDQHKDDEERVNHRFLKLLSVPAPSGLWPKHLSYGALFHPQASCQSADVACNTDVQTPAHVHSCCQQHETVGHVNQVQVDQRVQKVTQVSSSGYSKPQPQYGVEHIIETGDTRTACHFLPLVRELNIAQR